MFGIIPAAGIGSRIQPLAFSKELLPVGSRMDGQVERPKVASEFLVERMLRAGATRLCFVISTGKSDIVEYYGGEIGGASICYVVQPRPAGLCDAIFRALPFIPRGDDVVVGLPDTIWFPEDGLAQLPDRQFSFLTFPVEHPEWFDSVITEERDVVSEIQVKRVGAKNRWVWGAFKLPVSILGELHLLWQAPSRGDEYVGTLVNAWISNGGRARAFRAGRAYVDVGTLNGYREAIALLHRDARRPARTDRERVRARRRA